MPRSTAILSFAQKIRLLIIVSADVLIFYDKVQGDQKDT